MRSSNSIRRRRFWRSPSRRCLRMHPDGWRVSASCARNRWKCCGKSRPLLEIDRRQDLRGLLIERLRDRQQTLDAWQVRAALDGADLRDAEPGLRGQVLEGPVALHAQHLDAMTQALAQAILRRAAEAERLDRVLQHLAELRQGKRLGEIVENLQLEGGA